MKGICLSSHVPDLADLPICIDGRMLGEGGTGVATYARMLSTAVAGITDAPFVLTARHPATDRTGRMLDLLRRRARPVRRVADGILEGDDIFRRAHVHFRARRRLYRLASDIPFGIMHWTYPVPIAIDGWINVHTIHDTIPLDRPDLTSIDRRRHLAVLRAIARRTDAIVTVSAAAAATIAAALGAGGPPVVDLGQAVEVAEADGGILPAGLDAGGYLLSVGSIEPRKNLAAMLEAYRRSGTRLPLVLAGPDGWRSEPILAEIAATPGAIRVAYLSRADLLATIAGARALVFPSLAEGFGLPMVEAMALGTPVLTSNRGALAEVAGGAALLVDPEDIDAIAAGIARIATDDALGRRLAVLGRDRAAGFTVARFADRLATCYAGLLRSPRRTSYGRHD